MQKTYQIQITLTTLIENKYEPSFQEIQQLIEHAMDIYTTNLPPEDLGYNTKCKVHLVEDITQESENISDHDQFQKDMKEAGLEPYHYEGRSYWKGPAVNVDEINEAMDNTKVPCQWDSMGLGFVVYPKSHK